MNLYALTQFPILARILKGVTANSYGQLITICTQLISVPIYIKIWGLNTYGQWLVLCAIPAYFILVDLGLAAITAQNILISISSNNHRKAILTYQQSIYTTLIMSIGALTILTAALIFCDVKEIYHIEAFDRLDCKIIFFLLCAHSTLNSLSSVFISVYNGQNRYSYSTFLANSFRLIEWIFAINFLMFTGNALYVAASLFFARLITLLYLVILIYLSTNYLKFRLFRYSKPCTLINLKLGLHYMVFPFSNLVSNQYLLIAINSAAGSGVAASFSIYRTICRLIVQGVNLLNHTLVSEFSMCIGLKDWNKLKKIYTISQKITIFFSFVSSLILYSSFTLLQTVWLKKYEQYENIFLITLLTSIITALWQPSWALLLGGNQHMQISFKIFYMTILSALFYTLFNKNIFFIFLAFILTESAVMYVTIKSTRNLFKAYNA